MNVTDTSYIDDAYHPEEDDSWEPLFKEPTRLLSLEKERGTQRWTWTIGVNAESAKEFWTNRDGEGMWTYRQDGWNVARDGSLTPFMAERQIKGTGDFSLRAKRRASVIRVIHAKWRI